MVLLKQINSNYTSGDDDQGCPLVGTRSTDDPVKYFRNPMGASHFQWVNLEINGISLCSVWTSYSWKDDNNREYIWVKSIHVPLCYDSLVGRILTTIIHSVVLAKLSTDGSKINSVQANWIRQDPITGLKVPVNAGDKGLIS